MRLTRTIWLAALTVFLCGILVGIGATLEYQAYKREHRDESMLARLKPRVIHQLDERLHLRDEQRRVVELLVSQAEGQLLALRMQQQPYVEEIVARAATRINATLTSKQQLEFDDLLSTLEARWRKDRLYARERLPVQDTPPTR
jgi:predicted negative regulator of RcsB-dependent stress response